MVVHVNNTQKKINNGGGLVYSQTLILNNLQMF